MRYSVVVGVAIEKTVYRFDKPFDYSVPTELIDVCKVGCRVTVPFGRGNTKRQGVVLYLSNGAEITDNTKMKNIISVIDKKPLLTEELLGIVKWLKAHTFCTYYDAVKTLLPFGLNIKMVSMLRLEDVSAETLATLSKIENDAVAFLRKKGGCSEKNTLLNALNLTEESVINNLLRLGVISIDRTAKQNMKDPTVSMASLLIPSSDLPKLTPKQKAVVDFLDEVNTAGVKEVAYYAGVSQAVITALEKKGILKIFSVPVSPTLSLTAPQTPSEISLTAEQQKAYDKLLIDYNSPTAKTSLLYGVTGSGKTSIFLKLVDHTISSGKSAIVMVPEIALTPQTLSKFKARYGDKVAVFHSAMSLGARMEEWKKAASGSAVVAIGTRSAVFAPLNNVGLIIMDEEQEHTYKSEQSPRFHARDVANIRCKYHSAMLLLASATPSVESYCHAREGRYGLVTLKNRYGNAVLPSVVTVDMRQELAVGNTGIISRALAHELVKTIENKKQAILLLNRRGHNTYISCPACGHVFNCENCSISLTYHSANNKLMCHYCGTAHNMPEECPDCKNKKLRFSGVGTQRAYEEIASMFPNSKILRLDADTTLTRDAFEKGLTAFAKGEYDIMLGTQMVAKGLDFPNVTLVGVLSADQSMHSDDFRAFERTFSLLTQVIGRSGRGSEPGIAIVQTHEPENDIIELACNQDYDGFYSTEILTRRLMIYPPYCDIVMLGVSAVGSEITRLAAVKLFELIKNALEKRNNDIKMIILGPTVANVPRVNSKYRQRIILKTKNTPKFREFLHNVLLDFYANSDKTVSVFVDVNPESII
ncbi:MAG: primosomal protein N' [Ruminococcaceae bacterium]|nr:primosomal protein N' [Oscillospiraceae bacterium]